MKSIRFDGVTKIYPNGYKALENVSFTIEKGEFFVLVGPSGCGKSTVLKLVTGLEDISSGNIYFDNTVVNDLEPSKRAIGMVFQNYALYPHMSVAENLAFPLKIAKWSRNDTECKIAEIAELIEMKDFLDRKPAQLSGGQRQRVALGRALVRDPEICLMDEPLSNLDAKLRQQMRTELVSLHKKIGATTVYVTHDQIEAMTMGSKILVMDGGKIMQQGTPEEIYLRPANVFVAAFIGTPQMNLLKGELIRENGLKFVSNDLRFSLGNLNFKQNFNFPMPVTLGIRQEHIKLGSDGQIKAKVEHYEYLGYEKLISLASGTTRISARVGYNFEIDNEDYLISFDTSKLNIFDNLGVRLDF